MKDLNIFLLLSVFMMVVFSGCATKCDDFDNTLIDWMPYRATDRIAISNNGNSDTLTVNFSEIHHTDKIGFGVKCACENSYLLNLSSHTFTIEIRFYDSGLLEHSEISVNDDWYEYSEQLDELELNGKTYSDLIIYKNTNSAASSGFEKIIVAKTIGIVAISGVGVEWIINDDTERQVKISDIVFIGTDC